MDAIIVPSGRPVSCLQHAIDVAKEHDAWLVLMCSLRSSASDAALAAERAGVRTKAIDVRRVPDSVVPKFASDGLLRSSPFHRLVDTSLKRNLGLLIAVLCGWKRIMFLDDDIVLSQPSNVPAADGLPIVGLANAGMPDNSVVCHALRDTGEDQDVFIGGGALVVGEAAFSSFFPNIYNEDWFFLIDGLRRRSVAVTGAAIQAAYDPYCDPRRARSEELGDILAEGIFALLDIGRGLEDANGAYWAEFLRDRRRLISAIIARAAGSVNKPEQRARVSAALKAAIGRSRLITPELCVRYLHHWQSDCLLWRAHLRDLRRGHRAASGIEGALATLGIAHSAQPGMSGRMMRGAVRRPFFR
ncbi:hypothetical protein [Amycolatopsis sp. NPDC004169]|uniref:hypothetical protein n=1 Tax=Amycolatopsis sp. NPDC004169 TaxID=3154453 RepID=UPI0033A2C800